MDESQSITVDIPAGTEYRVETEPHESIAIRSLTPHPLFINHQELPPQTWYPLYPDSKVSIWNPINAPEDARIEVSTEPSGAYSSSSSTYPFVQNLHLALERRRIMAKRAIKIRKMSGRDGVMSQEEKRGEFGPRVLVLGAASSGKSTLVKGLVNLALSSGLGWGTAVAGLDPSNSPHLVPGSLSLSIPLHPSSSHHPYQSLGLPPSTTPSTTLSSDVSTLGWFLGTGELKDGPGGTRRGGTNWAVWRLVVAQMAERWRERCDRDEIYRASGLFIDTHSSFILPGLGAEKNDRTRYGLVRDVVEKFDVDTLLVIGNEKLTVELERLFPSSGYPYLKILRVPKSSGTVDLDEAYRNRVKNMQSKAYFYGEPEVPAAVKQEALERISGQAGCKVVAMESGLHPYSFTIGWDDLEIYRVGQDSAAPSSAMPIGQTSTTSPTRLSRVDPSASATIHRLQNAILGLVPVSDTDKVPGWEEREAERQERIGKRERRRARLAAKQEEAESVKAEVGAGADIKQEVKDTQMDAETATTSASTGEVNVTTGEDVKVESESGAETVAGMSGITGPSDERKPDIADAAGQGEDEEESDGDDDDDDEDEDEEPIWDESIAWREVAGFLAITRIDTAKRKYEVLTPSPGKLPSMVAIVGNVEWAEEDN